MKWIIDSSIAIKWFVEEEFSQAAIELIQYASSAKVQLIAPDFILIETANILWKKCNRLEISNEQATQILSVLPNYFNILEPSANLLPLAQEISQSLNHPIYDCLYLASAQKLNAPFITADAKLHRKINPLSVAFRTYLIGEELPKLF
jgi:predicted nucleic acid-binding protein